MYERETVRRNIRPERMTGIYHFLAGGDQSGQKFRERNRQLLFEKSSGDRVSKSTRRQYHEFLYKNRLIDFDDMLVYTKEPF